MGEGNAELASRIIRDLDALLAHLDPEVAWDNTRISPPDHSGTFEGKAEVARIIQEWVGSWEGYRLEVAEVVEVGDSVVLEVTEFGAGRASGVPLTHHHAYLWTFRDGLIVSGSEHASKADAIDAAARGQGA